MDDLAARIASCRACPRLVSWRERVARERRAAFAGEEYWGRPVPGFGDPAGRLLVVGLAPAAHGANRTGRMFTGDRSGDWLFRALHRSGFASQPTSTGRDDGLRLRDCWITAAVRCAPPGNRPEPDERERCRHWLEEELDLLRDVRVVVCLGQLSWTAMLGLFADRGVVVPRPRPAFRHLAVVETSGPTIVASYHPSQQNTFTGRLTEDMLDAVFTRVRAILPDLG
ncbi:MAG: uracil-DNA glycosylase [Acidimicrobiia bacterium]|nr:uracil-DNA glycosylase [Acidimicrobiia bacterium]